MANYLTNTDADLGVFLESQLTEIQNKSYDVPHADLKAKELFPVNYSLGDGVDYYQWLSFEGVGLAKLISSYALKDIPRADAFAKKNQVEVYTGAIGYAYTIDDIKKSIKTGVPLEQKRANTATRANFELQEKVFFYGDTARNMPGLLNHPNIPRSTAAKVTVDNALTTSWDKKNSDQILQDLYDLYNTMIISTNEKEVPNTLLLSLRCYNILSQRSYSDKCPDKLLKLFQDTYKEIKVERLSLLSKAGANNSDLAIFYNNSIEKIEFNIPVEVEHYEAQREGLEFVILTRQRIAGCIPFYPMSLIIGEGF